MANLYTVVAIDSRIPRDGRFLEKLGQYHPNSRSEQNFWDVKAESIKSWVGKGAILSDTVASLLKEKWHSAFIGSMVVQQMNLDSIRVMGGKLR